MTDLCSISLVVRDRNGFLYACQIKGDQDWKPLDAAAPAIGVGDSAVGPIEQYTIQTSQVIFQCPI